MAIPSCRCGNHIKSLKDLPRTSSNLDASFVHLDSVKTPLSALNQAETLLKVAEGNVVEEGIWLCVDCLDRCVTLVVQIWCNFLSLTPLSAARALEADSERLGHECQAYNYEVKAQQERLRALERTLTNGIFPPSFDEPQDSVIERLVDLRWLIYSYNTSHHLFVIELSQHLKTK